MNKVYARVTFALVSFLLVSPFTHAQLTKEKVIKVLDETLRIELVSQLPHHFCAKNSFEHTYSGEIKIIRTGRTAVTFQPVRIEERLTIWGNASVTQASNFMGSESHINFYAELREVEGKADIVKIKWKQNDCMQYVMLFNKDEDEFMPEGARAEILAAAEKRKEGKSLEEIIAADREEFPLPAGVEEESDVASMQVTEPVGDMLFAAVSAMNVTDQAYKSTEGEASDEAEPGEADMSVARVAPAAEIDTLAAPAISSMELIASAAEELQAEAPVEAVVEAEPEVADSIDISGMIASADPMAMDIAKSLPVEDRLIAKAVSIPQDTAEVTPAEDTTTEPVTIATELVAKGEATAHLQVEVTLELIPVKKNKKKSDTQQDEGATHIVAGTITSTASTARIKDAELKLEFYTKTDTKIASETRMLYEFFEPGQPTTFSYEVSLPEFAEYPKAVIVKAAWVE